MTSEIFRMQQQDDKHYADLSLRLDTKVENQNVKPGMQASPAYIAPTAQRSDAGDIPIALFAEAYAHAYQSNGNCRRLDNRCGKIAESWCQLFSIERYNCSAALSPANPKLGLQQGSG